MDLSLIILLIAIGTSLLILIGVALAGRRAPIRPLVWWVGLACLPVGFLLAGGIPYLIDAWNRMAEWWQLQMGLNPLPANVLAGLVLLGLGVVLMVGSRVIPLRPRKKRPPKTPTTTGPTAGRTRPDYSASSSQTTPTDAGN